jgi:hypothetical protein
VFGLTGPVVGSILLALAYIAAAAAAWVDVVGAVEAAAVTRIHYVVLAKHMETDDKDLTL